MKKALGEFSLSINEGGFGTSEILVMLGENGTGKTTFIRMLAGHLEADGDEEHQIEKFPVSYKPQKISPKFDGTVRRTRAPALAAACLGPRLSVCASPAGAHAAAQEDPRRIDQPAVHLGRDEADDDRPADGPGGQVPLGW
jgi:energy-coupling factor transporter ATP-binding protein EcfA2